MVENQNILDILRTGNPLKRAIAARQLNDQERHRDLTIDEVNALTLQLDDPDEEVRFQVVDALLSVADRGPLPPITVVKLSFMILSNPPRIAAWAARALRTHAYHQVLPSGTERAASTVLSNDYDVVRIGVLEMLVRQVKWQSLSDNSVTSVTGSARDGGAYVQAKATEVLEKQAGWKILPSFSTDILKWLRTHPNPMVSVAAENALAANAKWLHREPGSEPSTR